jgi:predicted TIM-barrel enzyme
VGSGITIANIGQYARHCDGFIVGSSIKRNGDWRLEVDYERAAGLVAALNR